MSGLDYLKYNNMTEFISLDDKMKIFNSLKNGDEESIELVIKEIDRLESRIKELEMGCDSIINKLNGKTYLKPEQL